MDFDPKDGPTKDAAAGEVVTVERRSRASARQIAANQRNALKSTGPRSLAGRARSSQNAIKHGLTAHTVIPGEDPEHYIRFRGEVQRALRPRGRLEIELARQIADLQWRMRRIPAFEKALLQYETYLQAVENEGISDDYDPSRNEPIDELAGTDADLVDPLRLGRALQSLLDRGTFERLTRYERAMRRDFVAVLKLFHEEQQARREREATPGGRRVDVPRTDQWIETADGRVVEKIDPP